MARLNSMFGWNNDLWRDFDRMQRAIGRTVAPIVEWATPTAFPLVNVWTGRDSAVVTAEIPGVKAADLDISVVHDMLTIHGSREPEETDQDVVVRRQERGHGAFTRSLKLPFSVDAARVEAAYRDGVLRVTLPRTEESKPKKIEITS